MLAILKKESINLFKSFKSIFIILFFGLFSYFISNFLSSSVQLIDKSSFYASIRLLVFLLGYLFVSILSHNCINKEIETKTIRLTITKISRIDFLIGKLLGTMLFWIACLLISFLMISIMGKVFDISILFMLIVTMIYFISIVLLLSTIITKSSLTNFIGLVLGLLIPILGLWLTMGGSTNLDFLKLLFPYYYVLKGMAYMFIPLGISLILNIISIRILSRKDL